MVPQGKGFTAQLDNSLLLQRWRALAPREQFSLGSLGAFLLHSQAPAARNLASTPQQAIDPERLQGMVTATAATQGLTIERLDNSGDGAVQLNLQPAPFAQLLRWFTVLQEQGVQIAEAGLDRAEDNKVAARLSLQVAQ